MKQSKEIRKLLKRIEPDLKRLLKVTESPKQVDAILVDCIRAGARSLIMARRVAKK